jgi:hypothetical protein
VSVTVSAQTGSLSLEDGLARAGAGTAVQSSLTPPPGGMAALLRDGAVDWGLSLEWGGALNLPTGPRVDMTDELAVLHWGRFSGSRREWGAEICLGHVDGEVDMSLYGAAGTCKQFLRVAGDSALFCEVGFGLIHLGETTRDLATQTNFQLLGGVGAQFRQGGSGAWQLEYRFQHISNADREYPNSGVNNSLLQAGYVWYR